MHLQRTLRRTVTVSGVSFFSGLDVTLRFCPDQENSGIRFVRIDLPGHPTVPALITCRVDCPRRTSLADGPAVVEMVEHVLAALRGLGVDNCRIEIDGPETPGCDGSSLHFARALLDAGIEVQSCCVDPLVVEHAFCVSDGSAFVAVLPSASGLLSIDYTLDYGERSPLGRQRFACDLTPLNFLGELAAARTFLLESEAEELKRMGWGRRIGPKDLLIFGPHGPVENALRHRDEPARHKALDILGDLALLGRDLLGDVVAYRSGHRLNAMLITALLEQAHLIGSRVRAEDEETLEPAQGWLPPRFLIRQHPDRAAAAATPYRYRLGRLATQRSEVALGMVLLAAWDAARAHFGLRSLWESVDFCGVQIDGTPKPGSELAVFVAPKRGGTTQFIVRDGASAIARVVARRADWMAQAA